MKKRLFALALTGTMVAGMLAGCGGGDTTPSGDSSPSGGGDATGGKVYYLNFKPAQDAQ